MSQRILFDVDGCIDMPSFILCRPNGDIIGEIPFIAHETIELIVNLNQADEISFDVYKYLDYTLNPVWDEITNFKMIWYKQLNACYQIQVDVLENDGVYKHITAKSVGEAELSQVALRNIEINTEDDIERDDYSPTLFYKDSDANASLLDRLLTKAPHYSVGHVDYTLSTLQRVYSFNEKDIKSALDEIAEDIGCLFIYNVKYDTETMTLSRTVNAYDMMYYCMNCHERFETGSVCPECGSGNIRNPYGEDTGVFVDRETLTDDIQFKTDVGSVKNCFSLSAGDDMMTAAVRMCMPSNDGYIWQFNNETLRDMSSELRNKISQYNDLYNQYNKTMQYHVSPINSYFTKCTISKSKSSISYNINSKSSLTVSGITTGQYISVTIGGFVAGEKYIMRMHSTGILNKYIGIYASDSAGGSLSAITSKCVATGTFYMHTFTMNSSGYLTLRLYDNGTYSNLDFGYGNGYSYRRLVDMYYDEDIMPITHTSPVVGFASLISEYYQAMTLRSYLQTSRMPTPEQEEITAETQLDAIINGMKLYSYGSKTVATVALYGLRSGTAASTVTTAIKNAAKIWYSTSMYDISVNTTSWTTPKGTPLAGTWNGTITLENKNKEYYKDDKSTVSVSVVVTSNYQSYVRQQLDRKLADADKSDSGAVKLFRKDDEEFASALPLYSADMLDAYGQVCQAAIDVLIEQGCGDPSSECYELYTSYQNKLATINMYLNIMNIKIDSIDTYIDRLNSMISDVQNNLDFAKYLGGDLYKEFAIYRREDTYKNDNYISDGLSDAEIIENARLFIKGAEREIYKSANLQHTISSTLYNLMLLDEFDGLLDKFEVGNWIRLKVDDSVYKLRLISYTVNFSDMQKIDVEFSDVTKEIGGYSDLRSILNSASSMASSYGAVLRQAENANDISQSFVRTFNQGLDLTNTKLVSNADNQEMVVDSHGITMKRHDPIIDDYTDEQIKMTNTTIAFTDDNWDTVKTAFGKYYDGNGNSKYGLIAEHIIGKLIAGGNLVIESQASDGSGDIVFRVDGDGVSINNNTSNGCSLVIDPNDGITLYGAETLSQSGDENVRTVLLGIDSSGNLVVNSSDIDAKFSSITKTADEISATVSSLSETVNDSSAIDNLQSQISTMSATMKAQSLDITAAVTKNSITTSTGYKFDANGLNISKSDSTISTKIDNNGMNVSDGGVDMLTADSSGVHARNLDADTYLRIGGRSRFENYGSGYTGCFWIDN